MPGELIPIVLFLSAAGVLIFRPLTTRIGKSIERSQEKKSISQEPQIQRMMQLMERMVDRMDRLEDRVDFTERMIERQRRQAALNEGPVRGPAGQDQESRRAGRDDVL
jgi:hypothetical protein